MTTNSQPRDESDRANSPPRSPGTESLLWVHAKATLVVVLEFIALQLVAVGLATGIYSLIPLLDLGFNRGFDDWMRAFQILSPTLSISGGAAIVLSSYFFHKLAREADQRTAEGKPERRGGEPARRPCGAGARRCRSRACRRRSRTRRGRATNRCYGSQHGRNALRDSRAARPTRYPPSRPPPAQPALTLSGGVAIVMSSYFFHKMAREADQRAAEANRRAAKAEQERAIAEQCTAKMRAEIAELRAELAIRRSARRRRSRSRRCFSVKQEYGSQG